MAQKKSKKKSLSNAEKVGIGIGLTATAVAAAGAYFLYGSKNADKNRKVVRSWMLRAKSEVLETLEQAENMTRDQYEELIETVGGTYAQLAGVTKVDLTHFKQEMKDHWSQIERMAKPAKRGAPKKTAKKVSKKAAQKTTKKTTKKTAKKVAKKKSAKKVAKKVARKKA